MSFIKKFTRKMSQDKDKSKEKNKEVKIKDKGVSKEEERRRNESEREFNERVRTKKGVEDNSDDSSGGEDDTHSQMKDQIRNLQAQKERRRQELLASEKQFMKSHPAAWLDQNDEKNEQRRTALLEWEINQTNRLNGHEGGEKRKQDIMLKIWQEEKALSEGVEEIQLKKNKDKEALLGNISDLEEHSEKLIERIMKWQEMQRGELGELLVEEDEAHLANMKNRECHMHLKKGKVIDAMANAMESDMLRASLASHLKGISQGELIEKLSQEDQLQRQAFEMFQKSRDTRHQLITSEIALVQQELAAISKVELQRKQETTDRLESIREQRKQLAKLLADLYAQRDARERQIESQVQTLENENDEDDFWLVQYQILLEKQPLSVQMDMLGMDRQVKELLLIIEKENPKLPIRNYLQYLTILSYEQMVAMEVKELFQAGVDNYDICRTICDTIKHRAQIPDSSLNADQLEPSSSSSLSPSPLPHIENNMQLWCQWECVICLDNQSSIVFLPCGHVCTCQVCSKQVSLCPMCRVNIERKFELFQTLLRESDNK